MTADALVAAFDRSHTGAAHDAASSASLYLFLLLSRSHSLSVSRPLCFLQLLFCAVWVGLVFVQDSDGDIFFLLRFSTNTFPNTRSRSLTISISLAAIRPHSILKNRSDRWREWLLVLIAALSFVNFLQIAINVGGGGKFSHSARDL